MTARPDAPPLPLLDRVRAHAATEPAAIALVTDHDGIHTYDDLARRAGALAEAFRHRLGLLPGARIGLWLENCPAWVESYLACGAAGLGTVGFNPAWTESEAVLAAEISEVEVLVCAATDVERARTVARRVPRVRHVVAAGDAPGSLTVDELVEGSGSWVSDGGGVGEHIVFTSGTTAGRPKAVRTRPRRGGGVDYRELIGVSADDRALVVTPFFHVNGLGGLLSALQNGASVAFPRRFSASRFWDFVQRHQPTYLMTLAPIVHIVLAQGPGPWEREHHLRVGIVPGAGREIETMEARLGIPMIEWYGMTEVTGSGTCTRLDRPRPLGSAGQRLPGSTMTILRPDGTEASIGEVGEVVFERESIVFQDYLNDPEATDAVLDGRWFRTGDLGRFDDDGHFFFVDRIKDIIRRGGENISSVEVEEALRRLGGVADAAVVGRPDHVLGERVAAFVVPAPGADLRTGDLRAHLLGTLAPYKVPEEVHLLAELPRTDTGKVQKAVLRDRLPALS